MTESKPILLRANSVFGPHMRDFVSQKQALGYKYNAAIETLNLFDSYCIENGVTEPVINEKLYTDWSQKRDTENESTHQIRVEYVRQFSSFLYNNGSPSLATFHPLPKKSKAFIPYIFSKEEWQRFLKTVDDLNSHPIPGTPVRHLVHPVLFRTLYGCGLRINEALKLKADDVDLGSGAALIRNAKGGKDRMVVMSDTLIDCCREYRANELIQNFGSEYFFPARDRGFYDSSTIYADFRKYLKKSGIAHRGRGNGPRLHDIRHTFAVNVLNSWSEQGKDIYVCLPILQRYLGHTRITATEKYLQLVPEAYTQVTNAFTEKFGDVFPEV